MKQEIIIFVDKDEKIEDVRDKLGESISYEIKNEK